MTQQKFVSILVFIDSNVEDYQSLISGVSPNAEVIILDETRDGIEQITERLAIEQNIEAIHIISHGSPGAVQLGANTLNSSNIESFGSQLKQWRKALTNGADILLYGCNVAAGSDVNPTKPNQFLQRLSELTGADIAASANPIGNAALGGGWELEVQIGSIEATPIKALAYSHILAATANPDNKAIAANSRPISIDVLGNDTGSARLSVQNISTAPTNGTATINDWIYAGSQFTSVNGRTSNRIARLNSDGSLDTTFNTEIGMNSFEDVSAIALDSSGKPLVGGYFSTVNGTARNSIARLNTDGTLDPTFNPESESRVNAIAPDSSGKLLVGGTYFTASSNYIARLNSDGTLDTTFFNPKSLPFGTVQAIALDSSGRPLVVAASSTANDSIARLNSDGSLDTTFNPAIGMNSDVRVIALDSSGKLLVGGQFNTRPLAKVWA